MPDRERPLLRIVRGNPDDTELAAVTAALLATATARTSQPEPQPEPMSLWADRSAGLRYPAGRRPLRPGPHAWRASTLPI